MLHIDGWKDQFNVNNTLLSLTPWRGDRNFGGFGVGGSNAGFVLSRDSLCSLSLVLCTRMLLLLLSR